MLVQAVTSAEDKRFFQHSGFDPIRIVKAAYVDMKEGRKDQGASTLSMQLARMFWLDQGKRSRANSRRLIITLQIEQRFSKQEIFEDYANQVDLGWRGHVQYPRLRAGGGDLPGQGPQPDQSARGGAARRH